MLQYKGYTGAYVYDEEDRLFHGSIDGIRDLIFFQSDLEDEVEREFRISSDVYLEVCEERGITPRRPSEDNRDGDA